MGGGRTLCGMAFCAWVGAEASIGIVACEDVAHGAIAVKLVECPQMRKRRYRAVEKARIDLAPLVALNRATWQLKPQYNCIAIARIKTV
jgi:hypothetical protein